MQAGGFIEKWLGNTRDDSLQDILNQRDQSCFLPDGSPPPRLNPSRRSEIMRILRQAALLWLVSLLFLSPTARAATPPQETLAAQAQTAYEEARFDDAIRLWLQAGPYDTLSADTLFNIGNASYRSGSPGHAALYYRRALIQNPGHIEARQNLHFIERKYGSLTIQRPDYQYMLARIPLDTWKATVALGAWMFALGLLVFPATRNGARARIPAAAALILGPMIAASAGLGWRYFPNDSEFAPIAQQAVVTESDVIVFAEASRNSTEVIDAPPGSLCEVIRQSGRWAYISFASKTRGWVPAESITPIIPQSPPKPPTIRKPKADGKSA
jgi:tetratricopeptide (TPR) repeat protein